MTPHNPKAYEYLLEAIEAALWIDARTRLHGLARAHYSGRLLESLEEAIARRRSVLERPDST